MLYGVLVRAGWAGLQGIVVQFGSWLGRAVWAWTEMEQEICSAEVSWGERTLCMICGEGMRVWAEVGPESVCLAC